MFKFFLTIFSPLVVVVILSEFGDCRERFDTFVLAQNWPQTACWKLNKKWSQSHDQCTPCKSSKSPIEWTLHGLWPNKMTGNHPFNCGDQGKFHPNLLNPQLRKQLDTKWASFKLGTTNEKFWNYEYNKHGTCAVDLPSTDTIQKYFSKAIELLDNHNAGKIFENSGILPGGEYSFADVNSALERTLGVNTYIHCVRDPQSGDQYIFQISICFDKSFNLINCVRDNNVSNCKRSHPIIYPKNLKKC